MWEIKPWQLFLLGGPLMWPILLCSVLSAAIIIEKFLLFRSIKEDTTGLLNRIFAAVRRNDLKEALAVCDRSCSLTAMVLKSGVLKYGRSSDEIRSAMEEVSRFEVPKIEERMLALAMIGNISPLLGLLGTVTGMCSLFHVIQVRAAAMNPVTPVDVAGGVWEALITTAAGLIVAIATTAAYNHFVNCQQGYVLEMEQAASRLSDFLTQVVEADVPNDQG